jgi:hypothetical protein
MLPNTNVKHMLLKYGCKLDATNSKIMDIYTESSVTLGVREIPNFRDGKFGKKIVRVLKYDTRK